MYATVADMIARYGETQIIRLSRPEDRTAETVDETKVNTALSDAGDIIDGYIRGRYHVPVAVPPESIIRATCILARYDLAQGEHTNPGDEMTAARKDTISWLENIARELVNLDIPAAEPAGPTVNSGPRMSDRDRFMSLDTLRGF
ncbi:gp436 family protein [Rhizobium sp.]|uniref:gp436 family protein n=1 Tax=Rhizobium sp. TaxID=391 RepID=UPI003F81CF4D